MSFFPHKTSFLRTQCFEFDHTQTICLSLSIPDNAKTLIVTNGPSAVDGAAVSSYDFALFSIRHYGTPFVSVAEMQNDSFPVAIGSTTTLPIGFGSDRPANPGYFWVGRNAGSPRTGMMFVSATFICYNSGG